MSQFCALSRERRGYGHFLCGENTVKVTVYRQMRWIPQLLSFQPRGVPPHIHRRESFLNTQLFERWFSQGRSTSWSPLSPNLTPLDSFLWGLVEDKIPLVPITCNNVRGRIQKNKWNRLYCEIFLQGNTESVYLLCMGCKYFLSFSFQRRAFSFCVTIPLLVINLSNCIIFNNCE